MFFFSVALLALVVFAPILARRPPKFMHGIMNWPHPGMNAARTEDDKDEGVDRILAVKLKCNDASLFLSALAYDPPEDHQFDRVKYVLGRDEALRIALTIDDEFYKGLAIHEVILICRQANDLDVAKRLFKKVNGKLLRRKILQDAPELASEKKRLSKLSVNWLSQRKPKNRVAAGEDPLIEVDRIVSRRSTLDPGPAPRARTVPINGSVASDVALAKELESEMLNDLQTSFSPTFYAPAAPPHLPLRSRPRKLPHQRAPTAARPQSMAGAPSPTAPPSGQQTVATRQSERSAPLAVRPARAEKRAWLPPVAQMNSERPAAAAIPAERTPLPPASSLGTKRIETTEPHDAQLRPTSAAYAVSPEVPLVKAAKPSRFAPPSRGVALLRQKAPPPPQPQREEEELAELAAFGEGTTAADEPYGEEGLAPEDLDALQLDDEDNCELPPLPDDRERIGHRSPRRRLSILGAALAVVLAAGGAFVLWGESSVIKPPIITGDAAPAKVASASTPPDDERNNLIHDHVDGAPSAEKTKLVTPGDDKAAASPAATGAAAPGDHPTADAASASDGDSSQGSLKKVPTLTVVNSGAPSSDDGDKLPPGVSAAVPPSAAPAIDGAEDAHPDLPAAASSGGVFVQVAARKSEGAAKSMYHDLQVKFPTILGTFSPNIQRADLGDKGIYYRVRVGPFALANAQKICGSFRAAGGDCLIAQH